MEKNKQELLVEQKQLYEQTLLYDFYGELLTPHQRSIYEDAICNDMSLGEIAQIQGISRQGVHDLVRRCDRILRDYESKLHLVEKFTEAKEKIRRMEELTGKACEEAAGYGKKAGEICGCLLEIKKLSEELLKEW